MPTAPPSHQLRLAVGKDGGPEIFRSFQGEGPVAGQVRAFIRLSGCNLHCRWCDTPYTWNWQGTDYEHVDGEKFAPAQEMLRLPVEEAAASVLALAAPGVVITGGEPLMQPKALEAFCQQTKSGQPDYRLEVETNGTLKPSQTLEQLVDLFVVSPKLPHAGHEEDVAAPALANHRGNPRAVFKFVAKTPGDVETVRRLTGGIETNRIWIMPEGRSPAELDRHLTTITPAVLDAGFNLTDRQHIRLFGDTRST
ncbi:7-carboxy-7-deazaguanine synthase QueE [Parvularcula maris]|uniref:7-carboxy-7-deazaguanine synthase n=1 Tax=Parvularcula maris TaxID=2965077 RepID=A0A9X2RIZ0_9PROT|nr:7-carboxy-7-deazaguanine synthase QueE [Parvularcula maris]MCQ8184113.1 7-carboxy-7-deazaguanine synthase QueE [Parvularcula maris]